MTEKINQALRLLDETGLMSALKIYKPEVISTILVGLDVENSDLDIACSYQFDDRQKEFAEQLTSLFSEYDGFSCKTKNNYVVAEFVASGLIIEVYGSSQPVHQQNGFRHFQVMKRLIKLGGESFRQQILQRKNTGLKTEPAIADYLQLPGDPYQVVLELEFFSDEALNQLL